MPCNRRNMFHVCGQGTKCDIQRCWFWTSHGSFRATVSTSPDKASRRSLPQSPRHQTKHHAEVCHSLHVTRQSITQKFATRILAVHSQLLKNMTDDQSFSKCSTAPAVKHLIVQSCT
ncbi:hypothetical protein BaRGS_00030248 [Batillaria attramentaria]|uniref:Uncharacterized protein n=1 Tax=Batillaria attramentaria TaxID=370345 RepID=A0ABD0JTW6_9CAEN